MTRIALIDYGSGNIHSAQKALEHVANGEVILTNNAADIADASHVVLPGVGAFGDCKRGLLAVDGMMDALSEHAMVKQRPFLGICVGMQLLARTGYEHGETDGLGWLDGDVVAIEPEDKALKIPHMGWNALQIHDADHPLLSGITEGDHAYFVHSFHMQCADDGAVIASVDYDSAITAIVAKENVMGTQFHPEKSQAVGLRLLNNFVRM